MNSRLLILTLLCGALTIAGVAGPLFLGSNPDTTTAVSLLRGMGALGFIGGLVVMFRFSGDSAPRGDEVYAPQPAPRTLESDPLGQSAEIRPLDQRLEDAIEASKRYSRTIGLIYYNIDSYRQIVKAHGAPAAEAAMDKLAATLKGRLRKTDRVERLGEGRIVVCIVLLSEKKDLESIRRRLEAGLDGLLGDALLDGALAFDVGMSIYPMGGYHGDDLIATARTRCEEARALRLKAARKLAAAEKREGAGEAA